jgi:S-layer protein
MDGETFTIKTASSQTVALTKVAGTASGSTSTVKIDGASAVTLNKFDTDITLDVAGSGSSFSINTTGAASEFTLTNTGASLSSLTIKGDQKATIAQALGSLKTIDASQSTGAVTIDASGLTADNNLTFTGGSAGDTLIFKAGYLTKNDVLDGGAGKDVIVINDTAPDYNGINAAKNFEVLALGTTAATVDIAQITNGINEFAVRAGNITATFNNALSTSKFAIDLKSGNSGTVTVANKVGENTTTVALDNQGGGAQTLGRLVLNGASTINLSSTGKSATDTNKITAFTHNDNANIVVTGNADLTFTVAGTTTGSKVDASGFTGALNVTSSGLGDVLIGGSGKDVFTLNGLDEVTGNGGADTFDVTAAVNTGSTVDVTIKDFSVGDKIVFTDQGTETWTKTKVDVSAATSLTAALDLAAAGDGSSNGVISWFQFGGNTYVVQDLSNATSFDNSTDIVVELVGLIDFSDATGAGTNVITLA